MARSIEKALSEALRESAFSFIPRGERTICEIYDAVKAGYPELCDDKYLCSESCRGGHNQPEWNHVVRSTLQSVSKRNDAVQFTGRRRIWLFR